MNKRQHHLNESSSARLGISQKLEILPSPNSKQTRSLGANFLMDVKLWRIYFDRRGDLNVRLVSVVLYIMWRSNFTIPHSFAAYICRLYSGNPPTFAAYICRQHLPPTVAAYICRIHLTHTFAAYILEVRLHFEQAPIFYACVNILGKCQYFDDFFAISFA
jgi:hypothetical protein